MDLATLLGSREQKYEAFNFEVFVPSVAEKSCVSAFKIYGLFVFYFVLGADKFDFLVSWLVFLHIVDKKQLFQQCFYSLKPGGKM